MKEEISVFVDDELDRYHGMRLIDQLKQEGDARETWRRYHLYGAVMREELPSGLSPDFASRVQQTLASEPVRLAPAALRRRKPFILPAAGLAVAASLLGVAILLQKPLLDESQEEAVRTVASTTSAPVPRHANSVDSEDELIVANSRNENIRERINRLLVEHNEYNPAADMTGMLPYTRFVSHTSNVE